MNPYISNNMKNTTIYLLLVLLYLAPVKIFSQQSPKEKVKTFKIAYITENLNLTSKEAQGFWPVYNQHDSFMMQNRNQERQILRKLRNTFKKGESISKDQEGLYLDKLINIEDQKANSRKKLVNDLKKVLPNTKILRLLVAEKEFHRKMMKRIRSHHKKK